MTPTPQFLLEPRPEIGALRLFRGRGEEESYTPKGMHQGGLIRGFLSNFFDFETQKPTLEGVV